LVGFVGLEYALMEWGIGAVMAVALMSSKK
jgi:hypothetical protein